ncbi:unnamed protein product [Dibothriocephalus latus]|uniref:Reverse transcriptase domain-containing protein n=1 Tax=Dibothriocephalus latus TaxID=60516 RepID=A0A3P6VAV6_DIBLA|nr:unnamed protein product [Dibothriocephalus latus]
MTSFDDLRLINTLPTGSKILQSLIKHKIMCHLTENNLLNAAQHGFFEKKYPVKPAQSLSLIMCHNLETVYGRLLMYADDLKVTYQYKPADWNIVTELIKKDLQAFAQWCCTWRLSLCWHKYSLMVVSNDHQPELSIDGHEINVPEVIKDLGISYSNSLNLSEYCALTLENTPNYRVYSQKF